MKTVFFESLLYKLITKNDFYYGSCPDIHITTPIPKRKISCCYYYKKIWKTIYNVCNMEYNIKLAGDLQFLSIILN